MPRPVKYSSTKIDGSLKSGNKIIGLQPGNYGPTSVTGWYNSISPTNGNFVVTEVIAGSPPRFYIPSNDDEWIRLAKQKGASGANVASVDAVKLWFHSQTGFSLDNKEPNVIVTNGLIAYLDSTLFESYPGSGNTWYDLSGNDNNGTLTNGIDFNLNGWIELDSTDEYINIGPATNFLPLEYHSLEIMVKSSGLGAGMNSGALFGLTYGIIVQILSGGSLSYSIANTDNGSPTYLFSISSTGVNLFDNKWHHIVCLRNSSNAEIYIDGELNSSSGNGGTWSGTNIWASMNGRIGDNPNNVSYNLFGSLNSPRIYNKALSSSEILQNYYGGPIVTDGLVLAVDAGNLVSYESGSTTAYSMTGSLSGSLDNGVNFLPNNGGTWDFDGTNDQINFGNQSSLGFTNGVFSVEAWIYIPSSWTGGSQYPNLVSKGASAGWDTDGWSLFGFRDYGSGTGYAIGIGLRNSGAVRITLAYDQPADTWLHVVGTLDGSSIKIYVNGVLKTSNTQDVNPGNNNTNVYIGRDPSSQYFPGKIAGSRLYNKTLSSSEVLQNFNAQKTRFGL